MPTKKPTSKKPVSKKPVSKVNLDAKLENVKKTVQKEAKFVEKESKELANGLTRWWKVSSTEEKVYTIL
jgi:hypothetical protein